MGDTRPVFTLQQDKLSGYTLVGNVRYPTRGDKLAAVPAGKMPVVPDEKGQANMLGGEAALWAENARAAARSQAVAARLRGGGAAVVGAGRHRRKQHVPAAGGDRRRSVVSVGLQQHAETAREFTRLSNSVQILPLQIRPKRWSRRSITPAST